MRRILLIISGNKRYRYIVVAHMVGMEQRRRLDKRGRDMVQDHTPMPKLVQGVGVVQWTSFPAITQSSQQDK